MPTTHPGKENRVDSDGFRLPGVPHHQAKPSKSSSSAVTPTRVRSNRTLAKGGLPAVNQYVLRTLDMLFSSVLYCALP
jgi:hypothetical protein